MSQEYRAKEVIHSLAEAIQRGGRSLSSVPSLLRCLIDEGLWQERNVEGETVRFNKNEFRSFVEAPYPVGLSATLETLEALCGHEPKVLDFIAKAKQGKPGRPIGSTNRGARRVDAQGHVVGEMVRNTNHKSKDTVSYAYNRLRSSAYEIDRETGEILGVKDERMRQLYDDVLEGRKSPNAAAIAAGFRKPRAGMAVDDIPSVIRAMLKRYSIEQQDEIIAGILEARK